MKSQQNIIELVTRPAFFSGGIRLENTATPSAVDAPPEVVDLPDSDDFPPSPPEPLESTTPAGV